MVIWKAVLERKHIQDVMLPSFAEILSTGFKDDRVNIWFKCDLANGNEQIRRQILIAYTGMDNVPDNGTFIGTVIKPSGIVLHVFELPTTESAASS